MAHSPEAMLQQYQRVLDADAEARKAWELKDKALKKMLRMAKMGRKASIRIPISANRAVEVVDHCRELRIEGKLFAPAFARRFSLKEVPYP